MKPVLAQLSAVAARLVLQVSALVIFVKVPDPVELPFSPEKTTEDADAKRAEKIAEHDHGGVDHF